jgi:hypothetical protein
VHCGIIAAVRLDTEKSAPCAMRGWQVGLRPPSHLPVSLSTLWGKVSRLGSERCLYLNQPESP